VEWVSGRGESAEEHLDVAIRIEPRWDRMDYVRYSIHLPPTNGLPPLNVSIGPGMRRLLGRTDRIGICWCA